MKLKCLPVIPTRNLVLFPDVTLIIALVRDSSRAVATYALEHNQSVGLVCQLDPSQENPAGAADLAKFGVFVEVLQVFELPDNNKSALVRAISRFKVKGDAEESSPVENALALSVSHVKELPATNEARLSTMADIIRNSMSELGTKTDSDRIKGIGLEHLTNPEEIVNTVATHMPMPQDEKIDLLAISRIDKRAHALLKQLDSQLQQAAMAQDIIERARTEISEEQREMFLRRQIEVMQQDLYGDLDDISKLSKKAEEIKLSGEALDAFNKGLAQLGRISPSAPDYSVMYNFLTTLLDLPWNVTSPLSTSLPDAADILNHDHYGMKKVKERILEQVAVSMANPEGKAPILCLVGAPGVGKTSLGKSVAKALGRKYQRVSLGGVADEAEIRGHRRTYIGAMPGRIIDAIRKAGTSNPLLLLDEIDKLSRDIKGDPSAALLEVLDPEQNCHFHDNFIDTDFDLSKVLFIATANTLDTIPRPLLDRMEVVEVPGYLIEEKIEIAKHHLIHRVIEEVGLADDNLTLSPEAITAIIEGYTSESGVRQLEKALSSLARKVLVKKLSGEKYTTNIKDAATVTEILGPAIYNPQRYEAPGTPGVVTGLAWTAHGGEILFVESSLNKGKGEKLTLTGNLGDVMKESATIAFQYVRSHADQLGIDANLFTDYNLHIHVPEGAVPKDGPSAGITMATSIASTFTQRKVRPRLAMTGEITLRGRVLPVGGIKEKILAAKRAGITDIIMCEENRRDIDQIEPSYLSGLHFQYVTNASDVLSAALQ